MSSLEAVFGGIPIQFLTRRGNNYPHAQKFDMHIKLLYTIMRHVIFKTEKEMSALTALSFNCYI